MLKTTGQILKGDSVRFEGQFHLDMVKSGHSLPEDKRSALSKPQAHIIENNPEFAVIEITCSCGTKTRVKCEHAFVESSTQTSGQNSNV